MKKIRKRKANLKEAKWKQLSLYCCLFIQVTMGVIYHLFSYEQFFKTSGVFIWVMSGLIAIIIAIINLVSVQSRANLLMSLATIILVFYQLNLLLSF
ncbi:MAG: hypothetical protein FWG91_06080 [Lachnospiraceae bacterium]|nr:hypothetical protein [Lachnospiraceae bacterium]